MSTVPKLTKVYPAAALPGGEIHVAGTGLEAPIRAEIAGIAATVTLSRPTRLTVKVPEGAGPGEIVVTSGAGRSNGLRMSVGVPMSGSLHPVANPAVDRAGNVYVTLSGSRGQQTPVSVFRLGRDAEGRFEMRPFAREILNPTGLAFGPDGYLYVSSRAEGAIYRVAPDGEAAIFAEGLGVATGIAFDREGALYVGDRSGTIFKIRPVGSGLHVENPVLFEDNVAGLPQETFVFATLEPSMAAYHLAFNAAGTLFVAGPTTSSNQAIHAIDRDGNAAVFFRGLGRAQGMAFDAAGDLLVAASWQGERGIVRITPQGEASMALAGNDLVGLALLPDGTAAVVTRDAAYWVAL